MLNTFLAGVVYYGFFTIFTALINERRDGRVVEGARLESV
jgi:hypothetical protein